MLISYFGGILSSSPTISILTHLSQIALSVPFLLISGGIAALILLGIGTGILTRDSRVLELKYYGFIAGYLLVEFLWDIVSIYYNILYPLGQGAIIIGTFIFAPLAFIYIFTVLDWYRGTTT